MRNLAFLLVFVASEIRAEIAVIANARNRMDALTTQQVQDMFLGRTRNFPDGKSALPIDQSSPLRAEFYETLTARPIEQIDAYWARILFSGQAIPPQRVANDQEMLRAVRAREDAIGYIDPANVDKSVRILMLLPR